MVTQMKIKWREITNCLPSLGGFNLWKKKNLINALIRDMQALKNLSQNLSLALDGFYESICKIVLDYYDV